MKTLTSARRAGSAALGVTLLAAMMLLAADGSYAQRENARGDRGERPAWRATNRGGERARSGGEVRSKGDGGARGQRGDRIRSGGDRIRSGGDRIHSGGDRIRSGGDRIRSGGDRIRSGGDVRWRSDGGRVRGDDRAYRGGDVRWKRGDTRIRAGGGDRRDGDVRWKGDGGRIRGGNWQAPRVRDGRRYVDSRRYYGAPRYYGGTSYYGGTRYFYHDRYYSRPVFSCYPRTITYVSFAIGLPYYCPVRYRHVEYRQPVVRYAHEIEVDNLPPAGCYYFDPFCGQEFDDLDSYTDHIDHEGHGQTIEIYELDSGQYVRTLEFVGGYWVVQG